MKLTNGLIIVCLTLALSGCGGRGKGGDQSATPGIGSDKPSASNSMQCPGEADVAAAVGAPVEKKPRGAAACYYETPDFETSVTIMSFAPSRADQLLEEMRSSAKPYGAEVGTIDVGERGYAWGTPAWGQGFTVAGGRGYMLDVSTTGKGGDMKATVVKLLKMMLG